MKLMEMEINMNFLDMLEEGLQPQDLHHGALKEINFNDTKGYDKHVPVPSMTVLPDYPDKVMTPVGGQDVSSTGSRKLRMQRCAHEGCEEVTYKSRTSRNWVCKTHQNKMNKDMLKRRLEERCRTPAAESGGARRKDGGAGRPGGTENTCGTSVASQFRPSLLEEVLNEKKMTLMRSPDVVAFLRGKQRRVEERKRLQLQLKLEPADTVSSSSSSSNK